MRKWLARLLSAVSVAVLLGGARPVAAEDVRVFLGDGYGTLPASEYLTMESFVVPLMENGEHRHQVTLVVALEFFDVDDRSALRRLVPRFRDAMYPVLFKLLTFRSAKPRIPARPVIKKMLQVVAMRVAGGMVKSVVVHRVLVQKRP